MLVFDFEAGSLLSLSKDKNTKFQAFLAWHGMAWHFGSSLSGGHLVSRHDPLACMSS